MESQQGGELRASAAQRLSESISSPNRPQKHYYTKGAGFEEAHKQKERDLKKHRGGGVRAQGGLYYLDSVVQARGAAPHSQPGRLVLSCLINLTTWIYNFNLAELAWARYDKVMALASVPGTDGQRPGAGAEEQLDNRPDPRAREAYAFFQHGAAELRGGSVDGWGG